MRRKAIAILAIAVLAISGHSVSAQNDQVAVTSVPLPADSDTRVSVPVENEVVGAFELTAGPAGNTVDLDNATNFTTDQFKGTHYARFTSGNLEGQWFTIIANGTDSLELGTRAGGLDPVSVSTPANLAGAVDGDTLVIVKFWTMGTLFPPTLKGITFDATTGGSLADRTTQVLIPNVTDPQFANSFTGQGKSALTTLIFVDVAQTTGWFDTSFKPQDDFVLPPNFSFIIRNTGRDAPTTDDAATVADEGSNDLVYAPAGDFPNLVTVTPLKTASGGNDVAVGVSSLFPVKLSDLELGGTSAFVDTTGAQLADRGDQILFFDPAVAQVGKSASETFVFVNLGQTTGWFDTGFQTPRDDFEIPAGVGIIVRKVGAPAGVDEWEQTPE